MSGQSIGEMALHFVERYGLMAIKIPSKFELRRFCRATGATALIQLGAPLPSELGRAASVRVDEIGGSKVRSGSLTGESSMADSFGASGGRDLPRSKSRS